MRGRLMFSWVVTFDLPVSLLNFVCGRPDGHIDRYVTGNVITVPFPQSPWRVNWKY